MKNKYLIFSQARSGSTTLAACLTIAKRLNGGKPITSMIQEPTSIRAGDRYMIQEELSELNFPEKNNKEDFQINNVEHNVHNPLDHALRDEKTTQSFLDKLYSRFTGIKHIWNNNSFITNINIINYVKEKNIPVIFLYRSNQFNAVKSSHIVKSSRIAQLSIEGNDKESVDRVRERLEKSDIGKIGFEQTFSSATRNVYALNFYWNHLKGHKCKLLCYEDFYFSGNKNKNLKEVCDFIGCNFKDLPQKAIKARLLNPNIVQSTSAICNKIENIKEYESLYDIHPYISKFRLK
tara:strand:- start:2772 stop:3647 length:876 start_codon:yes stop_codon:yes gene_type:complete